MRVRHAENLKEFRYFYIGFETWPSTRVDGHVDRVHSAANITTPYSHCILFYSNISLYLTGWEICFIFLWC